MKLMPSPQFQSELPSVIDQLTKPEKELQSFISKGNVITRIEKLPGDASTRKYYRIGVESGSFILMKMEPFSDKGDQLPFLVVQDHLAKSGVSIPLVHTWDAERGAILLEDLGDVTLLRCLQDLNSPEAEVDLYKSVLDQLIQMHAHASPKNGDSSLESFRLRFDEEKLMWEVDFAFEHFYRGYLKRTIPAKDFTLMRSMFEAICAELAALPTVFTHRDFHSRNIMVEPTHMKLAFIDFQDARMGPKEYDVVSLLRDSYYQLSEDQVDELARYYLDQWNKKTGENQSLSAFRRSFDLMAVQRNFKAIGSFSSFLVKRNDAGYLKYIGNTFENIRRTLLSYPEFHKLRELLFHYYYF